MPRTTESWWKSETLWLAGLVVIAVVVISLAKQDVTFEAAIAGGLALLGGLVRVLKKKDEPVAAKKDKTLWDAIDEVRKIPPPWRRK